MLNLHGLVVAQKQENSSRATPSFHSPVSKPNISIIQYLLPYGTNIGGTGNRNIETILKHIDESTSFPKNFDLEVLRGRVDGKTMFLFDGLSTVSSIDGEVDIWGYSDVLARYPFPTEAATWYVSSSNASDDQLLIVQGLDGNFNIQTGIATLDGQNQVEVKTAGAGDITFMRVRLVAVVSATLPAGRVFIAETDSLTSGEPQTPAKVKAAINLDPVSDVSLGRSLMAIYSTPNNIIANFKRFTYSVAKGKDIRLLTRVSNISEGAMLAGFPISLYQNVFNLPVDSLGGMGAKIDLIVSASTTNVGSEPVVDISIIETDIS